MNTNGAPLVKITGWHCIGDTSLSDPMMSQFTDTCVSLMLGAVNKKLEVVQVMVWQ